MNSSIFNNYFMEKQLGFIFNSKSCALIKFNDLSIFKALKENDLKNIKEDDLNILIENDLITKSKNEFYEFLDECKKYYYPKITIAPSLKCNFSCPYCYESKNSKIMSSKDMEMVLEKCKMLGKKYGRIEITWYGGEPLLMLDMIK